jgi:hypothetical protein
LGTGTKNPTVVLFSELGSPRYMNWTAMNSIRQADYLWGIIFKMAKNNLPFLKIGISGKQE